MGFFDNIAKAITKTASNMNSFSRNLVKKPNFRSAQPPKFLLSWN